MTRHTRAAVFHGVDRPLELREVPLPDLAAGEVLVKIECCTLCGSDLHTFEGRRETPLPTILGHEIMGLVAELPAGETVLDFRGEPLAEGDRITWSVAAHCGDCFFCRRGLPQKCERLFKYGHQRIDDAHPLSGGLAEHCHLSQGTSIFKLNDTLPREVACPANCATATVAAALRAAGNVSGAVVIVQGAGMLGLTACAMLRHQGAAEVLLCDIDAQRLNRGAAFGATQGVVVGDDLEPLVRLVGELTAGRGVDVALEMSGASVAVEQAIPLLRVGGRYVLVGAVFPGRPVSLSPERIVRRCLSIIGIHNYAPVDLGMALDFLIATQGKLPFADLIEATFPLAEAEQAFQYALEHAPPRVLVTP